MRLFSISLALAVAAICSVAVGEVRFERKIPEGKSSTETVSKIDQKLTLAGMDIGTLAENSIVAVNTAAPREANGDVKVVSTIESMKARIATQGLEYSFDSANPDQAGNSPLEFLRPVHKAALNRKATSTFDKDSKIKSVAFDSDALGGLPLQAQALVKSQFDPESVKKQAEQELDRLPSESVNKGDTWDRNENSDFGGGQKMSFQNRYTYQGVEDRNGKSLHKITSKIQSINFDIEGDAIGLKLKEAKLKAEEDATTLWYDAQIGQVVESETKIRVVGDLTFILAATGMELPSKLDLKIEGSTKRK